MNNIKKQVTFRIDADLIDAVRDIVYYHRELSLNAFIERAIADRVSEYVDIQKRPCVQLRAGRKMD